MSVTVGASTLEVGQSASASALLRDAAGARMDGLPVTWSSSNAAVASVSGSGVITALAPGSTQIMATSEGVSGSAALTVIPIPVAAVELSLASAALIVGTTTQATAITRDASGGVLAGRTVTWTSDNAAVATVTSSGVVTAVGVGAAVISATSEGRSGTASLSVTPVPVAAVRVSLDRPAITAVDSAKATATVLDSAGHELTGRSLQWTSSDVGVATVSSEGTVAAISEGTSVITSTSEGKSGSASLTVLRAPVAGVSVTLASTSLFVGQSTQASARLQDARGAVLSNRDVAWEATPAGLATISPTGLVTATGEGVVTISATSEGRSGVATLTSAPAPVASVEVALGDVSITAVGSTHAVATMRDARGNALVGRESSWSSSDPSVATVTSAGLVGGLRAGTTRILATSEGQTGSATLTVTPAPVASVAVALDPTAVTVGQASQATAIVRDARGGALANRSVTWRSDNEAVATISSEGSITTHSEGSATITGASEGVHSSAILAVAKAPVATVMTVITPSTVALGETAQASASVRDAAGNVLSGRSITWSSDNPAVAVVSPSGLLTTVSVGTAIVSAASEGRSGSASLTVIPAPVATVAVALAARSVTAVGGTQASVTLRDVRGVVLAGRAIVWSSSDPSVATIASNGAVSAVHEGTTTITATSEGQSGSADLTVTPAPVVTVSVALRTSTLTAVDTTEATATLRDLNGNALAGRAVTWQSSADSVAAISPTGVVLANSAGTTTITAVSEAKSGSATLTVLPAPVASVAVTLAPVSVIAGEPSQARATLADARARPLSGRAITWTSEVPSIATVAPTGEITTHAPGTVTISATSEGKSSGAALIVHPVPVAKVTVVLSPTTVIAGDTAQATAAVLDAANGALIGRVVTFSTDKPEVATVSASGQVISLAPGTAVITATSEGHSGSATLTVIPVPVASVAITLDAPRVITGRKTRATAVTKGSNGNILQGRAVTWATDNTAVATVDTDGVVTGVMPGDATLTASSESHSATASITIIPVPVAAVTVSLASATLVEGRSTQATAVTLDDAQHVLAGRAIAWSSDNAAVAIVAQDGTVSTRIPGVAHITAESEGITGSATITVVPIPVARVTVTLATATIHAGLTTSATAAVYDSAGNQLLNRTVEWMSDNPNVASVSSTGIVSAHFQGIAEIGATSGGVTGSRVLTVTPAPIATVTVTLASTVLDVGQSTHAGVVLHDSLGNVLTERVITWSSDNAAVASVSPTGIVTATGAGIAHVVASSDDQSGTALLTVTSAAPSAEPAGLTPITQRSFDGVEEDGWTTTAASLPFYTIASDPSAPKSPSHVGQIRYPAGWLGGDSPGLTGRDLNGGPTTIYLSMWVRLSSNWVGHPTGTNKIIHLWISHINRVYLVADGSDANVLTPRLGLQRIAGIYDNGFGTVGDALDLRPNLPGQLDVEIVRGRWHHWEVVLTSNTGGLANGSADWWLDGVQVGHYTGIPFVDATETRTWDFIGFDPTWGGRDGMLDQEQSIFMDHIYVSGRP